MLKNKFRIFSGWLLVLYLAIMSGGCGFNPLIMIAGEASTNKSSTSIDLPTSSLPNDYDALDTAVKVGRSLGYRLVLKKDDSIGLHYDTSEILEAAIGVTKKADVRVKQGKDKLYIQVAVSGDFGTGGQAYADRLMGEFKDQLLEKFAEVSPPPPQRFVQY